MEMSRTFNQIKAYAIRKSLPLIPIQAKNISLIDYPSLFYQVILDKIKTAKRRIVFSALYIGTESKEKIIIKTIRDNLNRNSQLSVDFVLDLNRANRADSEGQTSVSALEGLLANSDNVKLSLVKINRETTVINSFLQRFQKWNEIMSTYHSKVLMFDNDLIVTGANLSTLYFERRQDRYMLIKESRLLTDYMFGFLQRIGQIHGSMKDSIKIYNDKYIRQLIEEHNVEDSDTYVMPLVQFGPADIKDKEDFLTFLDSKLPDDAQVHISSGYFNPSSTVNSLRINSILVPSEKANGFYKGGWLLKYVPQLYSAIQKRYLDSHQGCKLFSYTKPGWSFHAKGVWVEGLDDLCVHILGSSNFNCRSSSRDFETQLVIITTNKNLAEKLGRERVKLWGDAQQMQFHSFKGLNLIYNIVSRVLKTFL